MTKERRKEMGGKDNIQSQQEDKSRLREIEITCIYGSYGSL